MPAAVSGGARRGNGISAPVALRLAR